MKNIFSIIAVALLLVSCENVVELDYKSNQSRIVIEGNITNQAGPYYVKITKSVGLTDSGTYPSIDNADVVISDDQGHFETLKPQGGGVYCTTILEGAEGRTYTLTVKDGNETYTAQSTMPHAVLLDSIKVEKVTIGKDVDYNLIPVYKDPVEKGNAYRFVLSVNNKLINMHMVQNDELKNGSVNTLKLEFTDDDFKLKSGDFVSLEMQCIDKSVSLFYTTLALMADTGPGGGTTPNNPPGNMSNGALGLFSAHTVAVKTVTIP